MVSFPVRICRSAIKSLLFVQEIRQRLARQLESHVAEVVTRQLRKKSRGGAEDEQAEVPRAEKKGSSGESSDEGFVKVRAPTEGPNGEGRKTDQ